jgi:hypothetical protein
VPPTSVFGLSTKGVSGLEKTDKTNKNKKNPIDLVRLSNFNFKN